MRLGFLYAGQGTQHPGMLKQAFFEVYTKFKLHFYQEIFRRFQDREASLTTVETFCMLEQLESGMSRFAQVLTEHYGTSGAEEPGAGAAGGMGTAVLRLLGGTLKPGIELLLDAVNFDELVRDADMVLSTGMASVQRKITISSNSRYFTSFRRRSAFSGTFIGFLMIFLEIAQRRSPIEPKEQRYPQKKRPHRIVIGKIAISRSSGCARAEKLKLPLMSAR